MNMLFSRDRTNYIVVFIISLILVLDLFLHAGQATTVDGQIHITTIAQYAQALKDGDFPVLWTDKYANYGLPIAIIVHQVPNYLGAIISFFVNDFVLSYNIVLFLSILLSGAFFYKFLRLYFPPAASMAGSVLLTFSPYKISNIYVRGAMPEVFSSIFIPVIMLLLYYLIKKRSIKSVFLLILAFTLLALTHPMLFLIDLFIFVPYAVFLLFNNSPLKSIKSFFSSIDKNLLLILFISFVFSIGLAAFYLIPLLFETKYFVYGSEKIKISEQYLGLRNFFSNEWYYTYKGDVFYRGYFVITGIIESLILIIGFLLLSYKWLFKKDRTISILDFAVVTGIILILFTTKLVQPFYDHIKLLAAIQFPWRMLSPFMFVPPIILAYVLKKINHSTITSIFILIIALQFLPQLYGKNYVSYSKQHYLFSMSNLYGQDKSTIWMGKAEDYPVKKLKYEIIEGKGKILNAEVRNSSRSYKLEATTPVRMVDYTFYFPGWKVYVDNKPVEIEFQDTRYRGVITYNVPKGKHTIDLKFENTKMRLLAKTVSVFTFISLPVLLYFLKKKKLLEPKVA